MTSRRAPPWVFATISKQKGWSAGSANDVRTKELVGNSEGWPRRAGGSIGQFSRCLTGVYYKCTGTVKRNITAAWPHGAEGERRQGCCSVRGEGNSDEEGVSHVRRGQRRKRHPMMCQARQELAPLMSAVYTFFLRRAQFLTRLCPRVWPDFPSRPATHAFSSPPACSPFFHHSFLKGRVMFALAATAVKEPTTFAASVSVIVAEVPSPLMFTFDTVMA